MMKLKKGTRAASDSVVPALRGPGPGDPLLGQPIADRRHGEKRHKLGRIPDGRGIRWVRRIHRMDNVPIRGDRSMPDNVTPCIELDSQICWCVGPGRRARTDQPKGVEEEAVTRRVD